MNVIYINGKINVKDLIQALLAPLLIGLLASLIISNETQRSAITILYSLIWLFILLFTGISGYRVKLLRGRGRGFYAFTLLFGFLWHVVMFRFKAANISFGILIVMIFSAVTTYFEFEKCDKKSARLMVPFIAAALLSAVYNFTLIE